MIANETLHIEPLTQRERQMAIESLGTPQAQAMIHVFFAERAVGKVPDIGPEVAPLPVKSVAIIGAGIMGGGIAMACANAGIAAIVKDADQAALDRGIVFESALI